MKARCCTLLLTLAVSWWWTETALAAGLYFTERGTKGLGRAGANVAGAQGFDAIGYNVAGLVGSFAGADFTQLFLTVLVRRELAIDDASGAPQRVYSPTIHGQTDFLPLPTLALAVTTKDERFTFAAGAFTPTFALAAFPATVQGEPSPARYTLSGFTDSRLAQLGAWFVFRPFDGLALGAGVHALVGTFRSSLAFSLSLPDRLLAAPEDPDYDAYGRINVGPMVTPSGTLGVLYSPFSTVRFGISADLPTWIDDDATFDVRLPVSPLFDSVTVRGKRASVSTRLPPIIRSGIEVRPIPTLALELAYVREFWSLHDQITVAPKNVRVEGIIGGPESLALPRIEIDRNFKDSWSLRFGAELSFEALGREQRIRTGASYEPSAVPPSHLSLSSLDFDKTLISVGFGSSISPALDVELAFAHLFLQEQTVATTEARLARVQPLSGNAPNDIINAGRYRAQANVLSAALIYAFR